MIAAAPLPPPGYRGDGLTLPGVPRSLRDRLRNWLGAGPAVLAHDYALDCLLTRRAALAAMVAAAPAPCVADLLAAAVRAFDLYAVRRDGPGDQRFPGRMPPRPDDLPHLPPHVRSIWESRLVR